jgi:hypothetical protein
MRKSIKPQSRRHIWMYDEDWDYIHAHVAPRTQLAPGSWTREILHTIVLQIREERRLQQEASGKLLHQVEQDRL